MAAFLFAGVSEGALRGEGSQPSSGKRMKRLAQVWIVTPCYQYWGFLVVEIDEIAASLTVLQSKSFENRGECNKLNKTQWKSRKEWGLQSQTQ